MTRTNAGLAGLLLSLYCAVPADAHNPMDPVHHHDRAGSTIGHHHSHGEPADSLEDEHIRKMREVLQNNSPSEFHMPGTSRFAFAGRDNKFYLSIGGYAKATVSYDFGTPLDNPNEFVVSSIPTIKDPANSGLIQFSAMQSHLCLNFVAMPGNDNQVGLFIGTNFLDNYTPTLQFAYLKYRGLKAGYDYSIFSDPAAGPPTIDYEGPVALSAITTTMVSYTASFGRNKEWSAGGGAEVPLYSVTAGDAAGSCTQKVPDIPGFIQYSWDQGSSWVRFSAILRNMLYRDELLAKNINKAGWGIQLSGSASVGPNLTAYYQATYGNGIASHMQDLEDGGLDMVPDAAHEGKMKAVPAWGAYLGLEYKFSEKVYSSVTYSQLRTYAKDYQGGDTSWTDQYRYGQYAVANVFWQVTPVLQTGIEYIYGRRMDYSGAQGHDNRLQCMMQLNF